VLSRGHKNQGPKPTVCVTIYFIFNKTRRVLAACKAIVYLYILIRNKTGLLSVEQRSINLSAPPQTPFSSKVRARRGKRERKKIQLFLIGMGARNARVCFNQRRQADNRDQITTQPDKLAQADTKRLPANKYINQRGCLTKFNGLADKLRK